MSDRPATADAPLTLWLNAQAAGDRAAGDAFLGAVYHELKRMAAVALRGEPAPDLLQPTALVHETFLRLWQQGLRWDNRRHFFGAAARGMRQLLVDQARRRGAGKHGAAAQPVSLALLENVPAEPGLDLDRLGRLLERLEASEPRLARLVELRAFGGLDIGQCADLLEVSPATVKRDWAYARAWLADQLAESP